MPDIRLCRSCPHFRKMEVHDYGGLIFCKLSKLPYQMVYEVDGDIPEDCPFHLEQAMKADD